MTTTGSSSPETTDPAGGTYIPGPPVLSGWEPTAWPAAAREPLVGAVSVAAGRPLAAIAIAIGASFQLLFVGEALGINAVLWTALLLASAAAVRRRGSPFDRADAWLPVAASVAAVLLAVRADSALVAFDACAMVVLTGGAVASLAGIGVTRRSAGGLMALLVRGGVVATTGATGLGQTFQSTAAGLGSRPGSRAVALGIGLLIALPIVGVFALLFASADAVFAKALTDALTWHLDLGNLPLRLGLTGVATWVAAGMLLLIVVPGSRIQRDEPFVPPARLGSLEATTVLVAIDLIFAVFVGLQAEYLFGGRDTIAAAGVTYSDYARGGFFELVIAAALVGGLICVIETVIRARSRTYRGAMLVLVGLTAVVLVSAALRLELYQQAYGWTELRFYVITAIAWLGLCLCAAAFTVLSGRSRWLPHAAMGLGLVVALAANVVGPQAFVARENVARALDPSLIAAGGRAGFDAAYLAALGDGAIPVLVDALPRLPPADRAIVGRALAERRSELEQEAATEGWPSWNLAREEARSRLQGVQLP